MEWEKKLTNIVKETESNLERAKSKLNSSLVRSMRSNSTEYDLRCCQCLKLCRESLRYISNNSGSLQPALLSGSWSDKDYGYNSVDAGKFLLTHNGTENSLVASFAQKIHSQNAMIDELNRRLTQSEKDKEILSQQLKQLRNEVTMMQRQNNLQMMHSVMPATGNSFGGWRSDIERELKNIHQNIDDLKQELMLQKKNSRVSNDCSSFKLAMKQLQKIVEEECLSIRNDLISTSCRLAKLESDIHGQSVNRTRNTLQILDADLDVDYSILRDDTRLRTRTSASDLLGRRSVSFQPPGISPPLSPDFSITSTTASSPVQQLRNKHKHLKKKLNELDHRMNEESEEDTETEVTLEATTLNDSPDDSRRQDHTDQISPATSEMDVSMLTTEPLTSAAIETNNSSKRRGKRNGDPSDYILTEDITTDVSITDDCLSIDDL